MDELKEKKSDQANGSIFADQLEKSLSGLALKWEEERNRWEKEQQQLQTLVNKLQDKLNEQENIWQNKERHWQAEWQDLKVKFQQDIEKRDLLINTREKEITELKIKLVQIHNETESGYNQQIEDLKNKLQFVQNTMNEIEQKAQDQWILMNQRVEEKDRKIANLQESSAEREQEWENRVKEKELEFKQRSDSLNETITKLREILYTKETELNSLMITIAEREAQLKQLRREMEKSELERLEFVKEQVSQLEQRLSLHRAFWREQLTVERKSILNAQVVEPAREKVILNKNVLPYNNSTREVSVPRREESTKSIIGQQEISQFTESNSEINQLTQHEVWFGYHDSNAKLVDLVGDFNNGQPLVMNAKGDGLWEYVMHLLPGEYRYRFIVDGEILKDPTNIRTIADDNGQESSLCIV